MYSEPWETSKMELFAKIVESFQQFIIFAKSSILEFERVSGPASGLTTRITGKVLQLQSCNQKPCQTTKMELLAKIINSWKPLTIFVKSFILDIWQDSEYTSGHCAKKSWIVSKTWPKWTNKSTSTTSFCYLWFLNFYQILNAGQISLKLTLKIYSPVENK